jgi:hypothetical protein
VLIAGCSTGGDTVAFNESDTGVVVDPCATVSYWDPGDADNDGNLDVQVDLEHSDGTVTSILLYGDGAFGFSPTPPSPAPARGAVRRP